MLESWDVASVRAFGDRPYEWVTATARFAVSPDTPGNDRIADLPLAPRAADGKVRFTADVRLLRPTSGGSGRALVVIPNRGRIGPVPFSADAPMTPGALDVPAAGDGFLLDRGWTIAWCGWQWDVTDGLALDAPVADVEPGWLRLEFRPDRVERDHALSDSGPMFRYTDYPTAGVDDPSAVLTVRTTPMGTPRTVPRSQWRFTSPTRFAVDGGFQPFHWYELTYRSGFAPVVGTGLLAVRDVAASLRTDHSHVFAYGVSQSGRFLRHFLHEGLNLAETGEQVFDGVFAHIASARRGEFNSRYAQPALTHPLNPAYGPPYDSAGLLARQRALGGVPKLMLTNSAWEYWRGDGALVHQDPHTGDDLPEDPSTRAHLLSGTDHLGAMPQLKALLPVANPVHGLDPSPVLRALLVQLVDWVCDGVEPSPSQVPRRADGTAVTRSSVLDAFPSAARPDVEHLPWTPAVDPDSSALPLELGEPLVALVSAVDERGNEIAGIRLPEVAVGAAAYTGWNPRAPVDGLPEVLYEMVGSLLPATGAASPVTAEAVVEALIADRFLLADDRDRALPR